MINKYFHHIAVVNFDGGPFLSTDLIFFASLKARYLSNVINTIGVIFYVLIYIEISKKIGILAIVDNAPSWIVTEGVLTQK